MKKILMVHHSVILGGGALSCFDIMKILKEENNEVLLALPSKEKLIDNMADKIKIRILEEKLMPLNFGYYNGGSNIIKTFIKFFLSFKFLKNWIKILRKEKPDLVILNSIIQWPMIILLNRLKIKNVVFVRETMKNSPKNIFNRLIKKILSESDGVSFLSTFDKNQWNLSNKIKQIVIEDGVEEKEYYNIKNINQLKKKLKLQADKFYVLYVGGINQIKGIETLLKAINLINDKELELLVLGELKEEIYNSGYILKILKYNQIKFLKRIKILIKNSTVKVNLLGLQKNMYEWYSVCNVVIFPVEKVHQGRPIYEAGLFRKPVIASDYPNYKEYLKPNINGLVFKPKDYKDLKEKILELKNNPKLSENLGENNQKMTLKNHNLKQIGNKVVKFLEL